MTDLPRERKIRGFLEDTATPGDATVPLPPQPAQTPAQTIPQPASAAVPAARLSPRPVLNLRPEAFVGEYPWKTPYAAARANLRQQFPLRIKTITNAKLDFLLMRNAIRSKAGFIENIVVGAVDEALVEYLMSAAGLTEEDARAAAQDPEPLKA
jgi:hypothetical protein